MLSVLEEVTQPEVSRQHILRRVDDWRRRIDELYAQFGRWLPEGYSAKQTRNVVMMEEMMRVVEVEPRELPVLEIYRDHASVARIEPKGLWIIGVNGRLDMYVGARHYVILDLAELFAPPAWTIASFSSRNDEQPLTEQAFLSILSQ